MPHPGNWTYVSSDGAEHQLVIHDPETTTAGANVSVYYSYDGSSIKAVQHMDPGDPESVVSWEVFLPGGTILEMNHETNAPIINPRDPLWEVFAFDPSEGSECNDPERTPCVDSGDCREGLCDGDPILCNDPQDCPGMAACHP